MTVDRRRITTAVPSPLMPVAPVTGASIFGALLPGAAVCGLADPALTVRRYIDHALICSACCR
ncbi:hypothetical protein ACIQI7_25310 [Kitasatospora sp. NPDC092039]|uniref:hypothetical protein n=1 Tax=Kitasatospora sp. NPDC092039 TaxID=3364086 RepID=UPI00380180B9